MIEYAKDQETVKIRVFISTFLTVASFSGILAMFSMIKDKLNKELHLEESFLSVLDSLYFIGKILGTLVVLLFPTKQPKRAYFLACTFGALCQLLLPLSIYFGDYGKYLMLVGLMGVGLCKSYVLTPFLFLSEYYNKQQDKSKVIIWKSFAHIGDIVGIFFAYLTIYEFDIRWDLSYDVCIFFYFMFAIIFYLSVEEKNFHEKEQKEPTVKQKIVRCCSVIKNFYKKIQNFLWCVDFCLQTIFIANIVFWFPYYFVQNGFGLFTAFIILAFYVANVIGTVVFEIIIQKFQGKVDIACAVMIMVEILILLSGTLFLQPDKKNTVLYIMMVSLIGFLSGGTVNRIGTADILQLVGSDKELKYYAIFSSCLFQSTIAIFVTTIVGRLMQKDHQYLFFIMITNLMLSLVVYIFRKFFIQQLQKLCKFDPLEYAEVEFELNSLE